MTPRRDFTDRWAGMCAFSSSESSSSTSTTNRTENTDRRIAATDEALVVQLESGASLELSDPGVLEAAGKALDSFEKVLEESLTFAGKSFDLASETLERSRSEAVQSLDQVIKAGVTIAVVGLAAWGLPRIVK